MKPELLAPAGNLEKLKWAVVYGADAVYFGTEFGSLRSFAGNFSLDDVQVGLDYLHANGKRGYVTLNIYPFSDEYERIVKTARAVDEMGADAIIAADLGVVAELKRLKLRADIHISTQANTVSAQAALAYAKMGAKRVNLARELSLEQIKEITAATTGLIETEVFAHGAVCFSYSGRCAISDYLTGYRANRGECKHPCRWSYYLVEEKRPGEYMPVFEDERGLYLFNCKDLALADYVPQLCQAAVSSLKIEGRMKSIHYIASVLSVYRQLLDGKALTGEQAMALLGRVPNRGYTEGFMKGSFEPEDYSTGKSLSAAGAVFVANALAEKQAGKTVLEVRNKIYAGEKLEVLMPDGQLGVLTLPRKLQTTNGEKLDEANNSKFVLIDTDLPAYSIVRRVKRGS
jgi:putative protease